MKTNQKLLYLLQRVSDAQTASLACEWNMAAKSQMKKKGSRWPFQATVYEDIKE